MKKILVLIPLVATLAMAQEHPAAVRHELDRVDAVVSSKSGAPFQATWSSLAGYRTPEWFRDAKFGIFVHWGVYSVPAFGNEWYPRNMYLKGSPEFEHHRAVYGMQDKFGYKDFIPQFTADHFDADAWASLFQEAGARYVVEVAEHCDGFPMYASAMTDWNAAKMGPKRDVVSEVAKAVRGHGLHFGVSSHRAEHWWWYNGGMHFPSDVQDSRYAAIYGPAQPVALPGQEGGGDSNSYPDPVHLERWLPPSKEFLDDWLARSAELVDKYHPELIYLDWWINQPSFAPYLQKFAAYYYDESQKSGVGPVLTYKEYAMPENAAMLDIERGKLDQLRLVPWQSDTSVSIKSWGYVSGDHYRTARSLIGDLVDIVSKNGNLLLNVGPRADGTIPDEARAVLLQIGAWLKVNGEAIYGTRPWKFFGEGTTKVATGSMQENTGEPFTNADIRFTAHGETLYAIALGRPEENSFVIHTLYKGTPYLPAPVAEVMLLGAAAPVKWEQGEHGLAIHLPAGAAEEAAYVFRIRYAGADGAR
jgi:alpha-L-fucosidase